MKLNLLSLLNKTKQSISFENTINIDKLQVGGRTIKFTEAIKVDGSVYKTESGMYLTADIWFKYADNCSRCLEPLTNDMKVVLSGRLIDNSEKTQSQDDDELLIYYNGEIVDLEDEIISTIILSMPMKSICSSDCKGLCSSCGINLNNEECNCKDNNIDPRLAKLKELLD